MDLSIIIPIYNKLPKLLDRCLRSINLISNITYEVILIDDGSDVQNSAAYKDIARSYQINYVREENKGVSAARNFGIQNAKGEYITFVDADDIILASNLNRHVLSSNTELIIYDVEISMVNSEVNDIFRLPNTELTSENLLKYSLDDGLINWAIGKLYLRKYVLNNNILFNTKIATGEDLKFVTDYLFLKPSLKYIDLPIYKYYLDRDTEEKRKINEPMQSLSDSVIVYKIRKKIMNELGLQSRYGLKLQKDIVNWVFGIYSLMISRHINISTEIWKRMNEIIKLYGSANNEMNSFKIRTIHNKSIINVYVYIVIKKIYHIFKPDRF